MRKISYLGWAFLLFVLILSGCGKLERGGTPPVNMAPEVFFTNVPEENDSFSISPLIYWYGTDEDGFIVAYQFAVATELTVELWGGLSAAKDSLSRIGYDSASWIDNIARLGVYGEHLEAFKQHQKNVRLYAEMNPDIYVPQHVFLRAVDNMDSVSQIKTRMYWRNNHAPQCSVDVDEEFVASSFYCLPETTRTWKGIEISWVGLDTLDYPDKRKQPDFYFKWELWGPYADTSSLGDPTATKVDSSLDSIEIGGVWIYDRWTMNESNVFKNLENYPDCGYGWYHFRVWSRDDAFVESRASATTFLRIIKPLFRYEEPSQKTILVMDHTLYKQDGSVDTVSNVWPFYETALSRIDDIYDKHNILSGGLLSEDTLSRYDLVILLDVGRRTEDLPGFIYSKYRDYMNVGGRVWIIGLNNYGQFPGRKIHYLGIGTAGDVGRGYFGVDGLFWPEYSPADPENLEFIGAEPFGYWGLPPLEMDPDKVKKLMAYDPTNEARNYPANGIPHVCYLVLSSYDYHYRSTLERRLYSFVSRRGSSSPMQMFPCATNFIGSTYRTAEFSFPLNLMKNGDEKKPGAYEAFRKMMQWLLEDLP